MCRGPKTSLDGPHDLGYSCVTMVGTNRGEVARRSETEKIYLSPDYFLKLGNMKMESQVIVQK